MHTNDIAEKIKFLRVDILKMTQGEFGSEMNVTRNTVKNWESGISIPNIGHIILMSVNCGVSTDYLLFENHPFELSLYEMQNDEYLILKSLIELFITRNGYKNGKL